MCEASPDYRIVAGGLERPDVIAMLHEHVARARSETAPGSAHALDLSALDAPDIRFWSLRRDGRLLSVGALKRLDADHGEIKSMFTDEAARGQGASAAMIGHIIAHARADGLSRLSLETGSWAYFARARAFYARHGFAPCGPFGTYAEDANSVFLTLAL
ncbi:MAG: GNAT family N-acetyltransferase [Sphingobium sp.]